MYLLLWLLLTLLLIILLNNKWPLVQLGGGFDLNKKYWYESNREASILPKPNPIHLSKFIDKVTHSITFADDRTQIGGPYRPPACPHGLKIPGPFDPQDPWRVDQIMCEIGNLCNWKTDDLPGPNRFEL